MFDSRYRALAVLTVLLMLVIYPVCGVYRLNLQVLDRTLRLFQAWLLVIGAIVFIGFVTKTSALFSREIVLTWTFTGFIAQVAGYFLVWFAQKTDHQNSTSSIVIGSGRLATHLVEHINNNPWLPDSVVGVIDQDGLENLTEIIDEHGVGRVYLAMPISESHLLKALYDDLSLRQLDIIWAPDIFGVELLNHSVRELGGVSIISLSETPHTGSDALIKTLIDFPTAIIILILTLPISIVTTLIIKVTSPGPILFKQRRLGFDGREFVVYKFRSMVVHQPADGKVIQASRDDARTTRIGRFIRRTSIDELPQLYNVLNGTMSLVGPRPHAVEHSDLYGPQIKDYMRRHRVKPGLTGLAQINGYRGETRNVEQMEGRIKQDIAYINNWSVWLDIKIIVKTLFVLLDDNAY